MTQSTISSHNSMKTMSLISLTFLGLMLPAAASAAATKQLDAGQVVLRDRLSEFGLAKSAQCVLKHCDSLSDMIYMSERQMRECGKVPVKVAKLQFFVSQLQEEAQEARSAKTSASRRWEFLWVAVLATIENFLRGFMLGCGFSFLFETLYFSNDFYAATDDLAFRVKNAALRAVVIGIFAAFASIGLAMFVPRGIREGFSTMRTVMS
jgi:Fe2+ transport system protein FeoA